MDFHTSTPSSNDGLTMRRCIYVRLFNILGTYLIKTLSDAKLISGIVKNITVNKLSIANLNEDEIMQH